jgi:hypothetical protein
MIKPKLVDGVLTQDCTTATPAAFKVITYRGSRNQKKNENGVFWRDDGFG